MAWSTRVRVEELVFRLQILQLQRLRRVHADKDEVVDEEEAKGMVKVKDKDKGIRVEVVDTPERRR